jgi:hypothetical protein
MPALHTSPSRLLAVALCLALWTAAAQSARAAEPAFDAERRKQQGIYHGRGASFDEGYVIDRSLLAYMHALSPAFRSELAGLGPRDRWLDIGAGMGIAVLDYHNGRYSAMLHEGREPGAGRADAVAMSIEDRRTPHWHETAARLEPKKIEYLSGKPLREYRVEELGRFQLITDVIGGFSYTENLSLFMERVLSLLAVNGSFHTLLQDVRSEAGANRPHYPGSPFLTEIRAADGTDMKVCSWLKSIRCVTVTCDWKRGWTPPVEVYRVHKVCEQVSVPPLTLIHYQAGTPPERGFRLANPPPADAARRAAQ